jgi:hypothetical protein
VHQQIAGAEHNPVCLLPLALHRNEAHARPPGSFTDCLGIRRVVLLPLHEWLDVGRQDQPYRVAQLAVLTRSVMRSSAGLHRHCARQLGGEELEQLRPHQSLAEHYVAGRIRPMCLENPLRDIQSDRASLSHGRLLKGLVDTSTLARRCRRGVSTPSTQPALAESRNCPGSSMVVTNAAAMIAPRYVIEM